MRLRRALAVAALTAIVGIPRLAGQTPDSPFYVDAARYFQGDLELRQLAAPYAYRFLEPLLVAQIPAGDIVVRFAILNLGCTILAHLLWIPYLCRLFRDDRDVNVGLLLAILSFPALDYSSRVLTDPIGFLAVTLATLLILAERDLAASAVVSVGVLARDSVILMSGVMLLDAALAAAWSAGRPRFPKAIVAATLPIAVFVAVRWHLSDLPVFTGTPSWHQLADNLSDPLRWLRILLTIGPLGLLLCGRRHRGVLTAFTVRQSCLLVASVAIGALFNIYSVAAFFMSARYLWPVYLGLVPLAVAAGRETTVYQHRLVPLADAVFGTPKSDAQAAALESTAA